MNERLQIVLNGLKTVFRRPADIATAAVFAFIGLFAAIWMTNLPLLKDVLFADTFSFTTRIEILVTSLGAIKTNFHALSRIVMLAVVTLFGINVAMVVYYLKRRFVLDRSAGVGIVGTIFGMLGAGCAPCGSVILTSLLGPVIVGILPFRGLEFGFIGIAVLIFSIYYASKRIVRPEVCEMSPRH